MNITFVGKRALVTGAGQGIGYGIAKALVTAGAETFALSKTQANLDKLKAEVPSVHTVCVNLADWDATRKAVSALGTIDVLVNNAAYACLANALDAAQEDFDKTMDVNVKAIVNVTQVVGKSMVAHGGGGSIVNISSQASHVALMGHLFYCTSKAAVDQLTRNFALELGPHNIRVNAVNPTIIMTEMAKQAWSDPEKLNKALSRIPLGRVAEVKDVVHAVLYLLSDQADMITGVTLPVDGGFLAC